jgi:hypothetical protein
VIRAGQATQVKQGVPGIQAKRDAQATRVFKDKQHRVQRVSIAIRIAILEERVVFPIEEGVLYPPRKRLRQRSMAAI